MSQSFNHESALDYLFVSHTHQYYKVRFSISGNPLLVNMGSAQWHIYF